ncbi:MAG: glycoside hydrolase family 32 protein [Terracidiphilus sp.]
MNPHRLDRRTFVAALGAGVLAQSLPRRALSLASEATVDAIAHDPLRPEFHLMPPHNWMNDPNGPIWWKGKYHLFYQLNPHAAVWGDMHWGHAISTDMVHWHHQPIALAPTPGGSDSEGCFSGSAVVLNGVPTFIYTGVQNAPPDQVTIRDGSDKLRETQLLATSEDDGLLRWTKLPEPVIAKPPPGMAVTGFRDPCPWRESDAWYLGIGSGERGKGGCVLLYRSQDLRHWEYLHKLAEGKPNGKVATNPCDSGEMWECPDFFELNGHHCLFDSTEGKVIWSTGIYDAHTHRFTPQRQGVLDHGAYYAPKSFVAPDGRRILWGWIQETRPQAEYAAAGWAGAMSLPRVLTVGADGQLEIAPAAEVESLRKTIEYATLTPNQPWRLNLTTLRHELSIPIQVSTGVVTVRLLRGETALWQLDIDIAGMLVRCGDQRFPIPSLPWPHSSLRMFLDGSVIESFIGGREALTSRVYTIKPGETTLEVAMTGGDRVTLSHWPLAAISKDRLIT